MEFSVLLSLYDKEKSCYLDAALESIIINQELKPNEVVLVEDGFINRELEEVIEKYKKIFEKLKIIKLEKNMGLGLALERGVKECSNNLIFRMDTDDVSHPQRFKKQIIFLKENPEIKILGTNAVDFEKEINNTVDYRTFPEKNEDILKFSRRRCPFLHPTIAFYKDIVLDSGNYRDLLFFEDYDLFLRVLKKYKGHNLQERLLYFRSDENVFKRRGGMKYVIHEYRAFKKFGTEKLLNKFEVVSNFFIRIIVRLVGNNLRKIIYKRFLRGEKISE